MDFKFRKLSKRGSGLCEWVQGCFEDLHGNMNNGDIKESPEKTPPKKKVILP